MSRNIVQGAQGSGKKTIEGYREVNFKDGGSYRGEWVNGVPHGFGTSTDPSGAEYIGSFFEGIPHGRGSHTWPNGQRYEGEYQHGKQHGCVFSWHGCGRVFPFCGGGGCLLFLSVLTTRHGANQRFGKWTHSSGDNYEGYWANDVRHGQGSYYSADARKSWFGEWRAGAQHKPMQGRIDAVRPVWATCFSKGERLYDTAQYDHQGHYNAPVYDSGNYGEAEPTYDAGAYGETTYGDNAGCGPLPSLSPAPASLTSLPGAWVQLP